MAEISLNDIIDSQDINAFKELFPDAQSLVSFHDNEGNNILHILAKDAAEPFFKRCFNHIRSINRETKKYLNSDQGSALEKLNIEPPLEKLLLERNNSGRLPANKDYATPEEKEAVINAVTPAYRHKNSHAGARKMTSEEERRNTIYKFLKRETKKIAHDERNGLYNSGASFSHSVPANDYQLANSSFYFPQAFYPTIRLMTNINDTAEDTRKSGLNAKDKNDTTYINYYKKEKAENYIEEYDEIIHDDVVRKGEYVSLDYIPITDEPLGVVVAKELDFPEDFVKSLAVLNRMGDTIKTDLKNPQREYLIRNLTTMSGAIIANDGEEGVYGLCQAAEDTGDFSILSVYTLALDKKENTAVTTRHELTHSVDNYFSDTAAFRAYVLLEAGRAKPDKQVKKIFNFNATAYDFDEFASEALAETNASVKDKESDPLKKEIFEIFRIYNRATVTGNDELTDFIQDTVDDCMRNLDILSNLYEKKLGNAVKKNKIADIRPSLDKDTRKLLDEKLLPEFVEDMKKAKELILKEEKKRTKTKEARHDDLYHKNLSFLPDLDAIEAVYAETKEAIAGQDKEGLNKLLKQALSDYQEKDSGKVQLFKIALIATEMQDKHFAYAVRKRFTEKFASVADFDKIASSEFDRTGFFRYANKLHKMAEITDPAISKEAISIALNSTANVVKVQQIIDEEKQKASGKSLKEIENNYEEAKAKADPDNVYSMIRLAQSAGYIIKIKKESISQSTMPLERKNICSINDANNKVPLTINFHYRDDIPLEKSHREKPVPSDKERFHAALEGLINKGNSGR